MWLGRWDPNRSEPDKKNAVVFKEYLVAKYERKQWYKEAADNREEPKAVGTPPTQAKLAAPPKVRMSVGFVRWIGEGMGVMVKRDRGGCGSDGEDGQGRVWRWTGEERKVSVKRTFYAWKLVLFMPAFCCGRKGIVQHLVGYPISCVHICGMDCRA